MTDRTSRNPLGLVFVPSRNFKPEKDEYVRSLIEALEAGITSDVPAALEIFSAVQTTIAWYGDLTNQMLIDQGQHYDERLDISDRRSALHHLKGLPRKKGFGIARYDRLPGHPALSGVAATVGAPLLHALGLTKAAVTRISKDLGAYWRRESGYSKEVLERVRTTIAAAFDANQRTALVTHGTGSVVAFDALWQLSHLPEYREQYAQAKIDLWLTLGSPLGDEMVKRQLLGSDRKQREKYPTNVLAWHNVAAAHDVLSHDRTVADDFRPMLKNRQISSIRDYRIYNMSVRYGRSDPHCILGYLIHPRVIRIVVDWMTRAAAAPPTNNL